MYLNPIWVNQHRNDFLSYNTRIAENEKKFYLVMEDVISNTKLKIS